MPLPRGRTSNHILLDCPLFTAARDEPRPDPSPDSTPTTADSFPQRTGLGFKISDDHTEVEDLDAGPVNALALDLEFWYPRAWLLSTSRLCSTFSARLCTMFPDLVCTPFSSL